MFVRLLVFVLWIVQADLGGVLHCISAAESAAAT
jgi:hypothetical protein